MRDAVREDDDAYSKRMDKLAARIVLAVDGERSGEVALACIAVIAFILDDIPKEQREGVERTLFKFFSRLTGKDN
jgi:hypothetical protein